MRTLLRAWLLAGLACGGACDLVEKLPPVQLCVTYQGRTFCASKVNGQWRFEADLTPEQQTEIINHIEGR